MQQPLLAQAAGCSVLCQLRTGHRCGVPAEWGPCIPPPGCTREEHSQSCKGAAWLLREQLTVLVSGACCHAGMGVPLLSGMYGMASNCVYGALLVTG